MSNRARAVDALVIILLIGLNVTKLWGRIMSSDDNMKSAEQTYGGFLVFLKWGTIVSAIFTAIVVVLVA